MKITKLTVKLEDGRTIDFKYPLLDDVLITINEHLHNIPLDTRKEITKLTVELEDRRKIDFKYNPIDDTLITTAEHLHAIPLEKRKEAKELAISIFKSSYYQFLQEATL